MVEEIWEALHVEGNGVPGGEAMNAVGFPDGDADDLPAERIVGPHATRLGLAGGSWAPGRLTRAATSTEWRWEPVPTFSMDMTYAARYWTGDPPSPLVRVRALVTLPWYQARGLAIEPQRRRELVEALPDSELARTFARLAQRYGFDPPSDPWTKDPRRNAIGALSYSIVAKTPDGRLAMSARVMIGLSNAMSSAVVTCAELRIDDTEAAGQAPPTTATATTGNSLPLSISEVVEFLAVAAQTATQVLPEVVVPVPSRMRWAGVPTVELQMMTERAHEYTGPQPLLTDLIDFAVFGESDRGPVTEMAVTIRGSIGVDPDSRRSLTRRAVVHMAQAFGHLDASEEDLGPE